MIDTISGYINLDKNRCSDFSHLITNDKFKSIKENYYSINFNLSNFKITINLDKYNNKPFKLWFNSSLPKFYYDNNLAQLDLQTTKEAIQMLSDNLDIDMSKAILTRIDFGVNLPLNYPVINYISCLSTYPRYGTLRYSSDSVTFLSKSGSRTFTYYDKLKEIRDKDKVTFQSLPSVLKEQNIIRYEIRLKKPKILLKMEEVQAKDLYNDTVVNKLRELWLNGHQKVEKISIGKNPIFLINGHNGLLKYLSYHGVERLGYENIKSIISELEFDVKNSASKRSKLKAIVRDLMKEVNENTLDLNLMDELDEKINFIREINF